MSTEVDHLVFAADSLEQGADWCKRVLGVEPVAGGRHALMGTHNRLLQLSSPTFAQAYLEIIAIDPEASPPGRPRWFGLDSRPQGEPSLVQVVARSRMLDMHRFGLIHKGIDPGLPVALSRGDLNWQMLLRADGQMPGGLPMLIQWGDHHPADRLPASGCALAGVSLHGVPEAHTKVLGLTGVSLNTEAAHGWTVTLQCPVGMVTLSSR
jgi:hypothetical protein